MDPVSINGRFKSHYIQELKYDGNRFSFSRTQWGDLNSSIRNLSKNQADYHSYLWDGKNTYQYDMKKPKRRIFLTVGGLGNYKYDKSILAMFKGAVLMGYFTEDMVRIDEIAKQAKSVKMRKRMEYAGGSKCYVVEIISRHGDYRLWIDPAHGYNIAKAHVLRDQGDIWIRDYRIEDGEQRRLLVSSIKFRNVDSLWVPVQAEIECNTTFTDGGYKRSKRKLKVTEINIEPDHEALKSFFPDDIEDGSSVWVVGNNELRYFWKDGQVVDKKGKKVDLEKVYDENKNKSR